MEVVENQPLNELTTMRLGGKASWSATVKTEQDLLDALEFAKSKHVPWFVLGGGSNVIARDDFNGLVILNRIAGFDKISENDESATYRIGAGEVWDSVVERLCALGLSGVEAMSAIPGYTGGAPIQNAGAYGQEIADTLTELRAVNTDTNQIVTLTHDDCEFSYRNSVFKDPETRHHMIISITLKLSKKPLEPPFYPSLTEYLVDNNITDYSPQSIRAAVIAIRREKLPPVDKIASAGSFFKNPLVDKNFANELLSKFPDAPHWDMPDDKVKLAAGWLIEQAGLKGFEKYGMQIYPKNALVLTNIGASSYDDLSKFKTEIIEKVRDKFGVTLEQEPETL